MMQFYLGQSERGPKCAFTLRSAFAKVAPEIRPSRLLTAKTGIPI